MIDWERHAENPHVLLVRHRTSSPSHPAQIGHLKGTYVVTPPRVWVPGGTSVVDGTTVEVVSVTVMVVAGNVYVPTVGSVRGLH